MRETETYSEQETYDFAYSLAQEALPGQVYCLNGDLGVGKTVFARGFGAGLGIDEPIVSPTFTILKEYDEGRLPLYHFDVYRIGSSDEMEEVGYFDKLDRADGVCLIEWSVLIEDVIPEDAINVEIKKDNSKGFDYRKIEVNS
ncbi:MAG: tRNA (adenosine(37)-N6)-threonylcarbamoyltransferase complex ATPase subunit type 1 TsaE [Eubacterium sp.]|nr:tRNA (adenosine(37)-N6)-threonylcarbamoyltransferase complex ATPase subunit type 1 TsaE [Eubacterium sp.]HCA21028.1 tRNA (adenosine(37)-N6)-threonylcarbamoyltransferase complex ATPase subunit type 1 TsaE [Lachnospiraceae bacterium]